MPAVVNSGLKSGYNDAWIDLYGSAAVKAESIANTFANAIMDGFVNVKFNFSITGTIGSSGYSGTEMVAGSFDTTNLKTEIKTGYTDLWQQARETSSLMDYINAESKFIGKAIENFFTQSIYQTVAHQGAPITKSPLQASVIESIIKGQLTSIYSIDKIGVTSIKAQNMGMAIETAIATAIPMVTGTAPISSPPSGVGTGPLV